MASVTITHVAERAGVSIKTVSRVLNRETNVSIDTRDRVNKAAAELNYRPNVSARSLAGARSYLVGLLLDNPRPDYAVKLQIGAVQVCRAWGYHLVLETLDSRSSDFDPHMRRMLTNINIDGVILPRPSAMMRASWIF